MLSSYSRSLVLTDIFPVAAVAATVGLRWPLCTNRTKKVVNLSILSSCISTGHFSVFKTTAHVAILISSLL
jgi:hypothetical protein